jgi:hypothetical protein
VREVNSIDAAVSNQNRASRAGVSLSDKNGLRFRTKRWPAREITFATDSPFPSSFRGVAKRRARNP